MEVKLDIREKRTEIPMRVRTIGFFFAILNLIFSCLRHGRGVILRSRQSKVFHATLRLHFTKIFSKMSQDLC